MLTPEAGHFANSDQPILDGFEFIDRPDSSELPPTHASIVADIAHVVHGRLIAEQPTPTERYYEELGGNKGTYDDNPTGQKTSTRQSRPRATGHVRDTSPRDSEVDRYWNVPVEVPPAEERPRILRNIEAARQNVARAKAAAEYEYLQQFPVRQQMAILRARAERAQRMQQ